MCTAMLRLERTMSRAAKHARADEVLEEVRGRAASRLRVSACPLTGGAASGPSEAPFLLR